MKKILFITVFCITAVSSFAQDTVYTSSGKPISQYRQKQREQQKGFDKSKIIFGGGVIFGIGGGVTNLGATPVIGYRITERFAAGIGLGYQYLRVKDYFRIANSNTGNVDYYPLNISIYSGSVWARYIVWNNIFLHAEPEMNIWTASVPSLDYSTFPAQLVRNRESFSVPRVLVGGGVRQPVSDRASLVVTILYDILQHKDSPYRGLDIRFGFNVGF